MATTITLPDHLALRLQQQALAQHRSVEAVAVDLLAHALERALPQPALLDVIARIQSLPADPRNIRPAAGSLAAALHDEPDIVFDVDQWEQEWAVAEAEIRAMNSESLG
ncbi:MAG TPA: hypothetical protein VGE07_00300 [Herpetosiphonaceae bacterium]